MENTFLRTPTPTMAHHFRPYCMLRGCEDTPRPPPPNHRWACEALRDEETLVRCVCVCIWMIRCSTSVRSPAWHCARETTERGSSELEPNAASSHPATAEGTPHLSPPGSTAQIAPDFPPGISASRFHVLFQFLPRLVALM